MTAFVLAVVLALFISAYCSLFEAALYSTRSGALEAAKAAGPRAGLAERFLELKRDVSKPIAAILILNTISHTLGATMAGVYGVEVLGQSLMPAFSIAFTLAILIFTEIVPKTVGVVYWRIIWPYTVWPLTVMIYALYPAIRVTEGISRLITKSAVEPTITEDEILAVVRLGQKEGQITERESTLVHNIIHLENKSVREIMTPRTVVVSLDGDTSVADAVDVVKTEAFTRFPLYRDDRENIFGYVVIRDIFEAKIDGRDAEPVKTFAKPISHVPESTDCLRVLTRFLAYRHHIAVAVDEFGGTAGIVTLEDMVETLLGTEIVDEMDKTVDLQELARKAAVKKEIS